MPNEVGLVIGDLCGTRAISAWRILEKCALDDIGKEAAYQEAFDACVNLADTLKYELQRATDTATSTADKLAVAERAEREGFREALASVANDRIDVDQGASDRDVFANAQSAMDEAVTAMTALTKELDDFERPGSTLTHQIVAIGRRQCLAFLDKTLKGKPRAIARKFENYRSMAEIGPGLLGVGLEISHAPTGVPSLGGLVVGAMARRWSEPFIGRRREAAELAYRKVAVHTLTTFLLPLAACTTASFQILAVNDAKSLRDVQSRSLLSSA